MSVATATDDQDQHEGDDGFGREDPPRGHPGGRGRGAEGGDRPGLVSVQAQVTAAAAAAPANWART